MAEQIRSYYARVWARSGFLLGGVTSFRSSRFSHRQDAQDWAATILSNQGTDVGSVVVGSRLLPEIIRDPVLGIICLSPRKDHVAKT